MAGRDRKRPPQTVSVPRDVCSSRRPRVRHLTYKPQPLNLVSSVAQRIDLCVCRQQDLFRVLKAYTLHRPEEGYCQAQAPIAAVLLMHMPAEVRVCAPL